MSAPTRPGRGALLRRRILLSSVALLLPLVAIEALLHALPKLLPAAFRRLYPPNGVEFFQPGILERTPITAVPMPFPVDAYAGPPPHDLIDLGIAPAAAAHHDATMSPPFVLPVDRRGLPNPEDLEVDAPIALVGDSFTVYGAQQDPTGFARTLARVTGRAVRSVAISGIGPDQELFLLQQEALPAKPKLVVWMFCGGNDLIDSFWLQVDRAQGVRTYADHYAGRRAPRLYLPSLLASLFHAEPKRSVAEPLPPFRMSSAPDSPPLWFFPDTLRVMALPQDQVLDNPGWKGIVTSLRAACDACRAARVPLLVAYLPSKEQIYLPYVATDSELVRRYALASALAVPLPATADATRDQLLQQRSVLEQTLMAFCAEEGIPSWSATPTFTSIAARGEAAFYATDTHWRTSSQAEVAQALAAHLQERNLLPR